MIKKIFIANDKGGVGKSTIAQLCVFYLDANGEGARIVEYDRQPKLKRFFPADRVISNSIAPEWNAQLRHPEKLAAHWDPMGRWLRVVRPLVVDLGAQAWDYFAAWAADVALGELIDTSPIAILVPVTADIEAVAGAHRIIAAAPSLLPKARVVLLACDKDGEVESLARVREFRDLMRDVEERGVGVARIPVMPREGYPALASVGMSFDRICKSTPHDLVAHAGLPPMVAARTIRAVQQWMTETLAVLRLALASTVADEPTLPRSATIKLNNSPFEAEISGEGVVTALVAPPVHGSKPEAPPESRASGKFVDVDRWEYVAKEALKEQAPTPSRETFDEQAYLTLYPDVREAVRAGDFASGYDHYIMHGRAEGRNSRSR